MDSTNVIACGEREKREVAGARWPKEHQLMERGAQRHDIVANLVNHAAANRMH